MKPSLIYANAREGVLMLDDLLFTLEEARKALPADAHPVHAVRLYLVERMVKRALEQEPEYWRGAMVQAEQIADEAVMRRLREGKSDA
jgi:hypothetical protein